MFYESLLKYVAFMVTRNKKITLNFSKLGKHENYDKIKFGFML